MVNGTTTKYLVDGSTVIAQQTGSDILWFLYDSDGTRVGFTYNGTAYYYTKNAQGDVTGIVDGSCNTVVEYSYDAWGKLLSTTGSLAGTIGKVNPFLYRGYYYDSETGLYYLNSRYYDPQTGRFVSEDGQLNPDTGLTGNNLFAYCNNNPVTMVDYDGNRMLANPGIESPQDQMLAVQYENEAAHKSASKSSSSATSTKPTAKPSAKNTTARDNFNNASLGMSIQKTAIGALGSLARVEGTSAVVLGVYGYVFSTPFAIFSHFNDPYLTQSQQLGLSALEVGLAVIGVGIVAISPVGLAGVLIGVGYAAISYGVSYVITDYYEKKNGAT